MKMFQKIIVFVFLFFSHSCFAQHYGLEFLGHEMNPDQRTSLVLGDDSKSFCFKDGFELNFELKLKSSVVSYFGYVFRIINEDGQNLDFLFNAKKNETFRIVSTDFNLKSSFGLDSVKLYNSWSKFRFVLNPGNQELTLYLGDKIIEKRQVNFKSNTCFKIYFGECKDPKFATKDVLPMLIRDINLVDGENVKYIWKLNQAYGNNVLEAKSSNNGKLENGNWLLKRHYEWNEVQNLSINGYTTFYFDKRSGQYIIHSDAGIQKYDAKLSKVDVMPYDNSYKKFTYGDQAYFLEESKNALNIRLTQKEAYFYDSKANKWNIPANLDPELTEYWHHNHVIFPKDSAVVLIGGYGQFLYKNAFQKYSIKNNNWSELKLKGDILEPRYMFGIGNTKKFGKSYLFGGFGSKSGDQEINPQNFYDLYEINWLDNSIKKIYTLSNPSSPFAVAKSLIIDEKNDCFYALIYNQLDFKSSLQLIKGSLSKPEYETLGKAIPYDFQDVASFADLAYNQKNQKLVCITSFFDRLKNTTFSKVYTLDFPPTNIDAGVVNNSLDGGSIFIKLLLAAGCILLVGGLVYYFKNIKKQTKITEGLQKLIIADLPNENFKLAESETVQKTEVVKVILFGGFQFLSAKGEDLTVHFTPLLKELFLYLLLNSIKWNKSVNSQQLNDMFWFDKSESSARNNRSVNLTKLKVLFEQVGHIQISKESGDWQIVFDPEYVCVDYDNFLKITGDKKNLSKDEINQLTKIISRGKFLSNLEFEWLESYKSEISNRVIDTYISYSDNLSFETDAQEIVEVSDKIFVFDAIDETAMEMKCKALVKLGKHSLAQKCYENFEKEYALLYSEKFTKSFVNVINGI